MNEPILNVLLFVVIPAFALTVTLFVYQTQTPAPSGPFQKGDKVTAYGNIGVVQSVGINGYLTVKFEEFDSTVVFLTDGRAAGWHKNVSLIKV